MSSAPGTASSKSSNQYNKNLKYIVLPYDRALSWMVNIVVMESPSQSYYTKYIIAYIVCNDTFMCVLYF